MKKSGILFIAIFLVAGTTAFADTFIKKCAGGNLSLVEKSASNMYGKTTNYGKYLFIFGDVAQRLQSEGLYPKQMVPGSTSFGLYWNEVKQLSTTDFGAQVRIANQVGPFFNYYFKITSASLVRLEIWQLTRYRLLLDGIQLGDRLVFQRDFTDCR